MSRSEPSGGGSRLADSFLAQRRCLITGAASGIGRRLVGDLAEAGARVLACDVDLLRLEETKEADAWGDRVAVRAFDVRDSAAWDAAMAWAFESWGGLDVAMNVAGVIRPGWIADASDDDVHLHFDVNTKGVVFGTRAAVALFRRMKERDTPSHEPRQPHVVNIASMASLAPISGIGLYSASKYAVRGFSLAAAEELRGEGIAVTVVCPDAVRTPMLDLQVDYEEAALTFTAPRFLEPREISDLILGKVLRKRPLLVALPWHRALLARLADLFPRLAGVLTRWLQKKGERERRKMQA